MFSGKTRSGKRICLSGSCVLMWVRILAMLLSYWKSRHSCSLRFEGTCSLRFHRHAFFISLTGPSFATKFHRHVLFISLTGPSIFCFLSWFFTSIPALISFSSYERGKSFELLSSLSSEAGASYGCQPLGKKDCFFSEDLLLVEDDISVYKYE